MWQPGHKVGTYTVIRKLGEGGMGTVYEAVHEAIGRRVALKVLHPELSLNPLQSRRFFNEARAANLVLHAGLVQIFDVGQDSAGVAYLIMELVGGESLDSRLRERSPRTIAPALATSIGRQVAEALVAAHAQGVVHRDIKPANVMLTAASLGSELQIKVLDFGVAKLLQDTALVGGKTRSGMLIGTAEYMAPELCRGDSDIGASVDVYALAVMLYEMLGGQRPFTAESAVETMALHLRTSPPSLRELAPRLPAPLCALIHRMLAKQATDRPTMAEVAAELARFEPQLSGLPSEMSPRAELQPAIATTFVSADALPPVSAPRPARRLSGVRAAVVLVSISLVLGYALVKRTQHRAAAAPLATTALVAAHAPAVKSPSSPPAAPAIKSLSPQPSPPTLVPTAPIQVQPVHRAAATRASTRHPIRAKDPRSKLDELPLPLLMRNKEPDGP